MLEKNSAGLSGKENEVMEGAGGRVVKAESGASEKPDLLEYLVGLEDVDAPEGRSLDQAGEGAATEPSEAMPEEKSKAELLAEHIRQRTREEHITSYTSLKTDDDNVDSVLEELSQKEELSDISTAKGQKDTYYYSSKYMANNYAMIAVLVEEKDLAYTVAQMVRFNCKTYPAPTPASCFTEHPYYFTKPQINRVRDMLKKDPRYEDIEEVITKNDKVYFHSVPIMSSRYARALAEDAEYGEFGYR